MDPALSARAEKQLGLFTTADARRAGYGHREIRTLCATGRWVRVRRGVLVTAEALVSAENQGRRFDVDCLAVLLSLGRESAVVSHASAARLWGLPLPRRPEPTIRLTDPHQWRRAADWHMTCAPLRPDERWRAGPVRLTSMPRTLVDCAREWPLGDAVVAMDAAVLAGRTTVEELRSRAGNIRGWPGASRAVRAAALADGRAESPLETLGRLRILGAGFPSPDLQVEIQAGGRLVAVADAWFDEQAVAVEFDGRIKYTKPWRGRDAGQVLWEEKRREDELRSLDIRVLRIADADLGAEWPRTERRLRDLLAVPGPTPRRFRAIPRRTGIRRAG